MLKYLDIKEKAIEEAEILLYIWLHTQEGRGWIVGFRKNWVWHIFINIFRVKNIFKIDLEIFSRKNKVGKVKS